MKVTYAKLHGPTFLAGLGIHVKDTIVPDDPTSNVAGMLMTHGERGLHCSFKGFDFFIPDANIQILVYAKDQKPTKK